MVTMYDPVGVYDSLEPVNTMKPVVANPSTTFTQLPEGLEVLDDEKQVQHPIDQIVINLQRKKRRMDDKTMGHFFSMTGATAKAESPKIIWTHLRTKLKPI